MKIIQVSENKLCEIAEGLEEMLLCIKELKDDGYGERSSYGMRNGSYGNRMGYREDDWEDMPMVNRYGERRMRGRNGRFI